jgi:hypothetical protein
MAKGRQYAEGLVGPLDRSYYETQRNVAKQTSQTNWEDLQNQYKNLQAKLQKEQEQANRDFANGLVQVAEGSLDRMNTAQDAMATSGLSYSGLSDVMQQADTTRKGQEVLDLMGRAGDVSVNVANQLASANTSSARKQAQLADEIADTLGQIGAGETGAQMAYNQGLAGIGEAMEAREAENDLAAKQRAANAAASGRSKELKKWEDDLEEVYRRAGILETLQSDELSDSDKATILKVMYDVGASGKVVDNYNINTGKKEHYLVAKKNAAQERLSKMAGSQLADARKQYYAIEDAIKNGTASRDQKLIYDYVNGNGNISSQQAGTAYYMMNPGTSVGLGESNVNKLRELYYGNLLDDVSINTDNITYEELANLIYGKK